MAWPPIQWAPPYAHHDDLRYWLGDTSTDNQVELIYVIEAASRAVDRATGRQFGQVSGPELRRYQADYYRGVWGVAIDDLMTADDLVVEVDGVEVTDYTLLPLNAVAKGRPWTRLETSTPLRGIVEITARWGWSAVPLSIRTACLMQASRLYARRENVDGQLVSQRVDDVEYRWSAATDLDHDVAASVAPYVRHWWAV